MPTAVVEVVTVDVHANSHSDEPYRRRRTEIVEQRTCAKRRQS
jgi:hypothetical protein